MPKKPINKRIKLILPIIFISVFFVLSESAQAAMYYISNSSGNDNNTPAQAQNPATPWKTIGKVNGFNFAVGDDVYFKCGDTWSGTVLNSDWSGSLENHVIIGAYYGSGIIGVSGVRPQINGGLNVSNWTSQAPGIGTFNGLVTVSGNYVTVENLDIKESGGIGIRVVGDNVTIKRNLIHVTYFGGVQIFEANDVQVLNNDVSLVGVSRLNGGGYPGAIAFMSDTASNGCKRGYAAFNRVYQSHGEGLDFGKATQDSIAEFNVFSNTRSNAMYMSRGIKRSIFRFNLIYCSTRPAVTHNGAVIWDSSYDDCPFGLIIGDEQPDWGYSEDDLFYGNLIVAQKTGIGLVRQVGGCPPPLGTDNGGSCDAGDRGTIKFFNNTVVNSRLTNIFLSSNIIWHEPSEIKNNIFLCNGESGTCATSNSVTPNYGSNLTWSHNVWRNGIKDADSAGMGDVSGDPVLQKTSGWTRSQIQPDSLTGQEFAILSSSSAKNTAATLPVSTNPLADFSQVLDLNNSNFLVGTGLDGTGSAAFRLVNQNNYGAWEIGADVYVGGDTQAPSAPGGLSLW